MAAGGLLGVIFAYLSAMGFAYAYFDWASQPQWSGAIAVFSFFGVLASFVYAYLDDGSWET